ncbi:MULTISPECIES: hypothetical protein [unclassified Novosphingobium]|uniref:hypothetical protein n=1 Tax=unclassified Novosphingobium TaxID=2644732 RepID=UPI001358B40D|nr:MULTISPECIES: hypothetical protein [unclassified Novosphingobium]
MNSDSEFKPQNSRKITSSGGTPRKLPREQEDAEGIRSLEEERRNPGANLRGSGGAGANPVQAEKGLKDERAYRESGVQAGTQRDPAHREEDG